MHILLYKHHWCMGDKSWFLDSGIIAHGSADQGFERMHYFQFMLLHKETFIGAIDRTKVESSTENFENVGAVSSKLIELRKSPSPALIKEILKLEACKVIKQHVVSTPVTESQMPIKYLKDVSTVLAVISAVREDGLCHINYARHSTYQHVCLNKKSWKKKI